MNAWNWATLVIFLGTVLAVGRRRVAVYYVINDSLMGEVDEEPITRLHTGQTVFLICHTSAFGRPVYSWRRKELDVWKEIRTQANFGVVNVDGVYQCSVSNLKASEKTLSSRIVQVQTSLDQQRANITKGTLGKLTQAKMVLKIANSKKFVPAKTSPAKFLIEPRDVTVHFGKPFVARCRLNVPVLACIWYRRDLAKRSFILLPQVTSMIGGKGNGSCAIGIPRASKKHEGMWICQPVTYNGTNLQSKAGIVTIMYPSDLVLTPDTQNNSKSTGMNTGSIGAILGRSVDYKPKLKINNRDMSDGQILVLNSKNISVNSVDVNAECEAYSPTKYANLRWKLGNAQSRTFSTLIKRILPASKNDKGDDLFLAKSTVNFTLRVAEKTNDRIKTAVVPVMCTAEDRWVTADEESDHARRHVTAVQLTLNHPVTDVEASVETSTANLICSTNGYPQPEVQWQTKGSGEWSDIKGAKSPQYRTDTATDYRCWARNEFNNNEKIYSNYLHAKPFAFNSSIRLMPGAYVVVMGLIVYFIRHLMF